MKIISNTGPQDKSFDINTFYRYYIANSFNTKKYGECVERFENSNHRKHWSTVNNPTDCAQKGGSWVEYHSYLELAPAFTSEAAVSFSIVNRYNTTATCILVMKSPFHS